MKKLIGFFAFVIGFAAPAMAQGVERYDFSAGGSFRVFQETFTPDEAKVGMPGWYVSGDYNFHKLRNHFGLEIEGSGNYRHLITLGQTSVYTLLVGPRIYPFGHHKLTPFGHVLFGGGYYREVVHPTTGFPYAVHAYGSGVWEAGVGLDMNVKKHWGVRMLEFDYAQTRFPIFGPYASEANYKLSIGINYRFGAR